MDALVGGKIHSANGGPVARHPTMLAAGLTTREPEGNVDG